MAALTGHLGADFSDFNTAVEGSIVELKKFEGNAGRVQTSLERMSNSLSGTKIIQDATIMAKAVENVGGVSMLTEKELARVSRTAQEAAEKMKKMGVEVPPGIQKIADAARTTTTGFGSMRSMVTSLAGAFGVTFGLAGLVQFGRHVFNTASEIKDMSDKLGISTEAVQGFQFAAEQSGTTLDAVGTAINKMNQNLAGGDKATVAALKAAGLEFDDIRSMAPEDAFLAIADAIKAIEDPMTRADVAMQVFGRSGAELLPAIMGDIRGVADAANKMSDDTIRDLEAAEDAWGELTKAVTIATGTLIADIMRVPETIRRLTSSFDEMKRFAVDMVMGSYGSAMANAVERTERASEAAERHKDVHLKAAPVIGLTADAIASVNKQHADQTRLAKQAADDEASLTKATADMWKMMSDSARKELAEVTAIVQKEMKDQRDAVEVAQLGLAALLKDSADRRHLAEIGGAGSMQARLEDMERTHQDKIANIKQLGLAAAINGQQFYVDGVQQLLDEEVAAHTAAQEQMRIADNQTQMAADDAGAAALAAMQGTTASATEAAAAVNQVAYGFIGVSRAVEDVTARIQQLERDAAYNMQQGDPTTMGWWQSIAAQELRNSMWIGTEPVAFTSFQHGGPVMETGPIFAHAGEYVLPKGAMGGVAVTINVNGSVLSDPNQIAAVVGDAFMQRMRGLGMRLPSGA